MEHNISGTEDNIKVGIKGKVVREDRVLWTDFINTKMGVRVTENAANFCLIISILLQKLKRFNNSTLCIISIIHFQYISTMVSFVSESKK